MQFFKHHDETAPGSSAGTSSTPAFARRHAATIAPRTVVGLAWYSPDDYAAARRMLSDGHQLPESYAQWESGEIESEEATVANGTDVTRVAVQPDAFMAWCVARHLPIDLRARQLYVADLARTAALAAQA
ncbi:MAG: hypothetical protein JWN73_4327 [Betaproteobacteria bacterium]|nr:hypothetical protein [Betaproteobacteria bacterium]